MPRATFTKSPAIRGQRLPSLKLVAAGSCHCLSFHYSTFLLSSSVGVHSLHSKHPSALSSISGCTLFHAPTSSVTTNSSAVSISSPLSLCPYLACAGHLYIVATKVRAYLKGPRCIVRWSSTRSRFTRSILTTVVQHKSARSNAMTMTMTMIPQIFIGLLALSTTLVGAVQNVKVSGSNFVNNVTNNRFQIIGVAFVEIVTFGRGWEC